MALTAQQLKANELYKAGKINAETYKDMYITKPIVGSEKTATANGTLTDRRLRKEQEAAAQAPIQPVVEEPIAAAPTAQALNLPTPADNTKMIQQIYAAQLAAQKASLNAARDQANSDYQAQIEGAPAEFQPGRDRADINAMRNMQRANETAAAKGTAFTGGVASDQGAIVANADSQKTALTQQEINMVQSLKKAIADNNKATSYKEVELTAQNQAQATGALIDERNRIYDSQYRQAMDQANMGLNVAGLTGYLNGQRTIQGQQLDTSNQQWNQQFDFSKEQADIGNQQWADQFEFNKEQTAVQNEQWQQTFDFQKERAAVQDGQWLKAFQADQANAQAGRAIQWAGLKLDREKFNASKIEAVDASGLSKLGREVLGEAFDMISATKKVSDDVGNTVDGPAYSQTQVISRIVMDPDLTEAEQDAILNMLGIKAPK